MPKRRKLGEGREEIIIITALLYSGVVEVGYDGWRNCGERALEVGRGAAGGVEWRSSWIDNFGFGGVWRAVYMLNTGAVWLTHDSCPGT